MFTVEVLVKNEYDGLASYYVYNQAEPWSVEQGREYIGEKFPEETFVSVCNHPADAVVNY